MNKILFYVIEIQFSLWQLLQNSMVSSFWQFHQSPWLTKNKKHKAEQGAKTTKTFDKVFFTDRWTMLSTEEMISQFKRKNKFWPNN